MQKFERETRRSLLHLGLTVLAVTQSNGGSYKFKVAAPNGKETTFFVTDTNDPHAARNNQRDFKAFAKQNAGHQTALASALASVIPTATPVANHSFALPPAQSIAAAPPAIEVNIPDAEPSPTPDTNSAPVEQKEPAMPKTSRASLRRLSGGEYYQLCEWLKAQDAKTLYAYADIARAATKSLGFAISPSTLPEAMKTVGLTLAEPPIGPRMRTDRVAVVARHLVKVYEQLGMEVDPDLRAVASAQSMP